MRESPENYIPEEEPAPTEHKSENIDPKKIFVEQSVENVEDRDRHIREVKNELEAIPHSPHVEQIKDPKKISIEYEKTLTRFKPDIDNISEARISIEKRCRMPLRLIPDEEIESYRNAFNKNWRYPVWDDKFWNKTDEFGGHKSKMIFDMEYERRNDRSPTRRFFTKLTSAVERGLYSEKNDLIDTWKRLRGPWLENRTVSEQREVIEVLKMNPITRSIAEDAEKKLDGK